MWTKFSKEEENCTGIYMIRCKLNNHCYIGSADRSFIKRWYIHFSLLRNNKHINRHLQSAWNKYGEDNFELLILEFSVHCESSKYLLTREQWYLDFYLPQYNNCKIAGNTKGAAFYKYESYSLSRKKAWNEESRKKHSIAMSGVNNPMYGKKVSKQTRKKTSLKLVGSLHEKSKGYKAVSPEGIEYTFKGLNQFCKEHKLIPSGMCRVATGERPHHKNWVCEYYDKQQITV